MLRKAQITAFIIIGLVLLIGAVFVFLINIQQDIKKEEYQRVEPEFVPQTISQHIISCATEKATPLIRQISLRGGELEFSHQPRKYNHVDYNYHCLQEPGFGCVNRLFTRQDIETQLNTELEILITDCIDFSSLEQQGYLITEAPLTVTTSVAVEEVEITVDYPIKIRKANFEVQNPPQSFKLHLPLGKLLDLAISIVNQDINNSYFDKDQWMYDHGAEVEIQKHKPYPDTVYSLRTYNPDTKTLLQFNFAVQGKDTVSLIGRPSQSTAFYGYCQTEDKNCYYNSMPSECVVKGGIHQIQKPQTCEGPTRFRSEECTGACLDCGVRKHGESWCDYESAVGDGLDFVGTRHYKKSCIDGKVYTEECRDFREELCTESQDGGISNAACRPNRWEDCAAQLSKEDCEDDEKRDCKWSEWLVDTTTPTMGVLRQNHICHPFVPPGFRHWQSQGGIVCGMANEQRDCDGLSCPQRWVDATAAYCYYQGDCGNYYNFVADFTTGAYFNSDGAPRTDIYPSAATIRQSVEPLSLRQDIRRWKSLTGHEFDNQVTLEELTNGIYQYITWLQSLDPEDYMWDYLEDGEIEFHVRHTALCLPWYTSFGGDRCQLCNQTVDRPCTEYKCKSLGLTCEYEEVDGVGNCFNTAVEGDEQGPEITFNQDLLSENYTATQFWFPGPGAGYENCWEIAPEVPPHTILEFGYHTSEPALCKLSPLPMINYTMIPTLSVASFNTTHQESLRVTTLDQIKQNFLDGLGIENIILLSVLETYEQTFQRLREQIISTAQQFGMPPEQLTELLDRIESAFYDSIFPGISSFLGAAQELVEQLVFALESRTVVTFVKCIDRSGNENPEEFCVKYTVGEDTEPPEILDAIPANKTAQSDFVNVSLLLNEPAECKYDYRDRDSFEQFEFWMDCPTSEFDLFFGNYICQAEIEIPENPTNLFFRCKDQPKITYAYYLSLIEGAEFRILAQKFDGPIQLIPPETINVTNDYALKENDTFIEINTLGVGLIMNFDEPMQCRHTDIKDQRFEEMPYEFQCEPLETFCNGGFMNVGTEKKDYYIGCQDRKEVFQRNVHQTSYVIMYYLS